MSAHRAPSTAAAPKRLLFARLAAMAAGMIVAAAGMSAAPQAFANGRRNLEIVRKDDLTSIRGPAAYFTGTATISGQFQREHPSRVSGAIVRFEPGARTAWHSHPLGQTLIVTEGIGWTQTEGGPIVEFRAGDILWCPPQHRHWHGATPTTAMSHIAIQEAVNGSPVTWMEHVPDALYLAGPTQPHAANSKPATD